MDTHEQSHSSFVKTIEITAHSRSRANHVSAVEGVQLPSPFLLGSNAPATVAAPASPILLPACRIDDVINVGRGRTRAWVKLGGEWAFADFNFRINSSQKNMVEIKVKYKKGIKWTTNVMNEGIGQPTMDTHEQPQPSLLTTIKISAHSPLRISLVSAVEGVQLPSPFPLGSSALATAAAPAAPILLAACGGDNINIGRG
jgi:hypothetical protein